MKRAEKERRARPGEAIAVQAKCRRAGCGHRAVAHGPTGIEETREQPADVVLGACRTEDCACADFVGPPYRGTRPTWPA